MRAFDGLRAYAVGAVILGHTMPNLARGGAAGVDVFFVLSGFLITSLLTDEIERTGTLDLKRFYLRRLLRLGPALLLMVATYVAASLILSLAGHGAGFRNVILASVSALTYVMNWARAFHLGPEAGLGHTWSLAIEEQFYLLWPALLWAVLVRGRIRPLASIVVLCVASFAWATYLTAAGADVMRVYNGFDARCWELLIGCALATLNIRDLPAWLWKARALPACFLGYAVFGPVDQIMVIFTWALPLIDLAAAWLIAGIALQNPSGGVLASPSVVYLGRISYGMYLWHWPITLAVQDRLAPLVGFVVVLAASIALASLSYVLVERPIMRWRARWAATA